MRRFGLVVLLLVAGGVWFLRSQSWEVGEKNFDRRVLQATTPVLVYFDTAPNCHGGYPVFQKLRNQRRGKLEVVHVNAVTYSRLASTYGVGKEVLIGLFDHGHVAKSMGAREWLGRVMAKNNGFYSDEAALADLESFVNLR